MHKRTLELFSVIAGTQTRIRNPRRLAAACSDGGRRGVGRRSCFARLHKLSRDIKHHLCEGANHGRTTAVYGGSEGSTATSGGQKPCTQFQALNLKAVCSETASWRAKFRGFFFLLRGVSCQLTSWQLIIDGRWSVGGRAWITKLQMQTAQMKTKKLLLQRWLTLPFTETPRLLPLIISTAHSVVVVRPPPFFRQCIVGFLASSVWYLFSVSCLSCAYWKTAYNPDIACDLQSCFWSSDEKTNSSSPFG